MAFSARRPVADGAVAGWGWGAVIFAGVVTVRGLPPWIVDMSGGSEDADRVERPFDRGDLLGELVRGQGAEQGPCAGHDRAPAVCELRRSRQPLREGQLEHGRHLSGAQCEFAVVGLRGEHVERRFVVDPVPLENRIRPVTCGSQESSGARIFIDQAVEDRPSVDPFGVKVGRGGAGRVTIVVGDVLRDALVRSGRVVVRLISGQNGAQMRLAQDQHPVKYLPAQGIGEAFADRVHAGSLDSGAQDPDAGGFEDGVERAAQVRSPVAD